MQIKKVFFGRFLPNMGGWGHSFPNKNHTFWTNENLPYVFPNITKTLGWERSHKKCFFLLLPRLHHKKSKTMPGLKHEAVPVSCTPIPRNLLKEHWLLPRGNVKDADGIRKSGVLVVPPDNPHMGRIQPAKSEWVPPTGRFH